MPHRNQTPNNPDRSESQLRELKVDQLRDEARNAGVSGASHMRKDELVEAVTRARGGAGTGSHRARSHGGSGGVVRTGPSSSKSLKYSQEITSTQDQPERPGRSLVTTDHGVIRQWAQQRDAVPATVEGTEHGDRLGVLRFDFRADGPDRDPGDDAGSSRLREVSWHDWFATFDERRLNFLYQEERSDGRPSNFFRLENPEREDA